MIPTINKPTRVTRNTATTIDHIITNTVISGIQHRFGIIKTDISDHFPIVFALYTCGKSEPENKAQFIYKHIYGKEQIELFKNEISQIDWNNIIKTLDNPNTAYQCFFNIFFETYGKYFPKHFQNTFKNLGLQKALQSFLRRNKSFINDFLKRVLHKMNRNTKIIRIFSK